MTASRTAPLVTIGVPVYNGENFLERSLASIADQTLTDLEVLVSDNGSSDATEEIARGFARRDERFTYSRLPTNLGAAPNYNRLVQMSSGKYFKWASHDDMLAPTMVERCVERLEDDDAVVLAFSDTKYIDVDDREISVRAESSFDLRDDSAYERLRAFLPIARGRTNPNFGLHRMSTLRRTSLIRPYPASDMILIAELCLQGPFSRVPEPLFCRRIHDDMSVRAYPSLIHRMAWFDTSRPGPASFLYWRWLGDIARIALHPRASPLSTRDGIAAVLAWAWTTRRGLVKDLGRPVVMALQGVLAARRRSS